MAELPHETELDLGALHTPLRVTLRPLRSRDDYAQCMALQCAVFGPPVLASAAHMKSCHEVGGLGAGAFNAGGEMLGCMFGISGLRAGRPAHWASFTAVQPGARGLGIGRRLKAYLRDFLLDLGIRSAYWSYDPLVARTAHFNFNRLGTLPIEYVRDYYGSTSAKEVHSEYDHDRFVVKWLLDDPRVERALVDGLEPADSWTQAPVLNAGEDGKPLAGDFDLGSARAVRVEVPRDIHACQRDRSEEAVAWRRSVRRAFEAAMGAGARFRGFVRDGERCFYVLERALRRNRRPARRKASL